MMMRGNKNTIDAIIVTSEAYMENHVPHFIDGAVTWRNETIDEVIELVKRFNGPVPQQDIIDDLRKMKISISP